MNPIKVHLDTDIGGDIDDLCTLAMLLHWPDVELTGITTVTEDRGRRAGYARYVLALAGRDDVNAHARGTGGPDDEPRPVPAERGGSE